MIPLLFLLLPPPTKTLPSGAIMRLEERGLDSANNGRPGHRHSSFVWVFVGAALCLGLCPPSPSFILATAPCLWVGGRSQAPEGSRLEKYILVQLNLRRKSGQKWSRPSLRQTQVSLVLRDVGFRYCHVIVWTWSPKGPVMCKSSV